MTTFTIDPAHTDILFSAKHMMVTTVRGTFKEVDGTIDARRGRADRLRAEIRVRAASLDTKFGARDNHLRSADFFDVERFPEIVVRSTAIRHRRGNDYKVTADVTIRDVTRSVDFDVEFLGFFPAMDGARRAGFSARAKRQPQGLGPGLERGPRGRRLARRRRGQARGRGRDPGAGGRRRLTRPSGLTPTRRVSASSPGRTGRRSSPTTWPRGPGDGRARGRRTAST